MTLFHPVASEADSENGSEPARPRPASAPPRRAGSPSMPGVTVIARRRKGQPAMATPLSRLPEPGDGSPQAAVTISSVTDYLLPATMRGAAAQAMAALGVL